MSADHVGNSPTARFEQVYADTRVAILGYLLRRCSDPCDAADLLAETYLTAWRRIQDIPDGDQALLWLYGVAHRTLANYHRHRRVENRLAGTLRAQLTHELDRESHTTTARWTSASLIALRPWSVADREVIELSALEQLTPAEIAVMLNKRPGAIRVRLHRIRRALRLHLLRAGYPASGHLEPTNHATPSQ